MVSRSPLFRSLLPLALFAVLLASSSACSRKAEPVTSESSAQPEAAPTQSGTSRQAAPSRIHRVVSDTPWTRFDADFLYTCAMKDPGSLWCWGMNRTGKLGDGTTERRPSPVQVGTQETWTGFSMADHVTCAVRSDNTLWCWGAQTDSRPLSGGNGRLTLAPERIPVVPTGSLCTTQPGAAEFSVVEVGMGDAHTCVITTDGSIICNGDQDRSGAKRLIPCPGWNLIDTSKISPAPRFKSLSVGSKHSCAVTTEDVAYCWGQNHRGQVGSIGKQPIEVIPTTLDWSSLPVGTKVRQLAAGTFHTCMILSDNTLACWGGNDGGCLANNDTKDRFSPTPVTLPAHLASAQWRQVDGGFHSTCALTQDGDIYCWGSYYCQRETSETSALACGPTPISGPGIDGMPPFRQLAVGCSHSCAQDEAGSLYCWGTNGEGELGNGTVSPAPVKNTRP